MRTFVSIPGIERSVALNQRSDGGFTLTLFGPDGDVARSVDAEILSRPAHGVVSVRVDGKVFDVALRACGGGDYAAVVNGVDLPVRIESDAGRAAAHGHHAHGSGVVTSPMPGKVIEVCVQPGDRVERGAPLIVVEAMKMQNQLQAERAGIVVEIFVTAGDTVESGARLLRID